MTPYVQNPLPRCYFTEPRSRPLLKVGFRCSHSCCKMHSFDDNKLWKFLGLLTRTLLGWGHGFTLDNRTHTRTHFSILRTQLHFLFVFRLSFFFFFWLISDSSLWLLQARSPPVPVGLSLACFRTPQNPDRAVRLYLSLSLGSVSASSGDPRFSHGRLHTHTRIRDVTSQGLQSASEPCTDVAQLRDECFFSTRV